MTSLSVTACAISHVHGSHGLVNPMAHHSVRQVRAGLRRTHGVAPRRQARPLSVTELRQIITAIDRSTVFGARDAAIILLGYASALRTGELAELNVADLEPKPASLLVHIHRSKTDQDGTGQVVGVAHGTHPGTDPVTAINTWLRVRSTAPGPLFVRLRGGAVSDDLSPRTPCHGYCTPAPRPPDCPAGSPATPCAPDTPPPPTLPASTSTASPARPGTSTSPSS